MPSIGDMQYGFSADGLANYKQQIKSNMITKAAGAVRDISSIENHCMNEWEGKARDNFLKNLKKDAEKVAQEFNDLFSVLSNEIDAVGAAMKQKDKDLINF